MRRSRGGSVDPRPQPLTAGILPARTLPASRITVPVYPILATGLLAGARKREGLGLIVRDVNFGRGTIRIWTNDYRRLKTAASHRILPLWPQLAEILRAYLAALDEVGPKRAALPGTLDLRDDPRRTRSDCGIQ